jgi:CBS domain containing-hemolysin-like protein
VLLPESMGVLEALDEMRQRRRTFALVLDEHGGVAGVVSTRDLLEPLVGDLLATSSTRMTSRPSRASARTAGWLTARPTSTRSKRCSGSKFLRAST